LLHDRQPAAALDRPQAGRAVGQRARQHDADHAAAIGRCRRPEQRIDRGPAEIFPRSAAQKDVVIVQQPEDAVVPFMPRSALRYVDVDYVRPADEMGELLGGLVREPAGPSPPVPTDVRLEAAIAAQELADMRVDDMLGKPSHFTCPECHGALWEIGDGTMLRFRCHVGHALSADAVLAAQGEEIDTLLGTLQRSHQERAALARKLAERERVEDRHNLADHLENRAREYEEDAQLVVGLMRNGFARAGSAMNEDKGDVSEDGELER
jgi:two-component system chemotaxis response regulator CheB